MFTHSKLGRGEDCDVEAPLQGWHRAGGCDQALISVARVQKVRNESENFGRDLVDWCDGISPGPTEVEDFESILFESVELRYNTRQFQSTRSF